MSDTNKNDDWLEEAPATPKMPVVDEDEVPKKAEETKKAEEEEARKKEEEEAAKKKKLEEDKDDDPLKLERTKKKEKKGPEASIADLRKSRDSLKEDLKKAQAELEEARKGGNEDLKPVVEYIENKYGPLSKESIQRFIDSGKARKGELQSLSEKLSEKDEVIKDFDIRSSEDFKTQYIEPHSERVSDLFGEIAMVDKDGNAIEEGLFKEATAKIAKNAKDITSAQAKAILKEIGQKYKETTGEDYEAPTVASFMSAVREVKTASAKMEKAYTDWDEHKKEAVTKSEAQRQRDEEEAGKKNATERRNLAQKALDDFDYESMESVMSEDEIADLITEEFRDREKEIRGDEQLKPYDYYILRGAKARMYDKIIDDYKKLKEIYDSDEDDDRDDVEAKKRRLKKSKKGDDKDWTDGFNV